MEKRGIQRSDKSLGQRSLLKGALIFQLDHHENGGTGHEKSNSRHQLKGIILR